uniref:Uncharacterized protein n=3 Tax=Physcomitrium patens TaxID=3218 RepID=A0A7I3Z5K1_PHYPA
MAVWPCGKGYEVWSCPTLAAPSFNPKVAQLGKLYRQVEMYEHHHMKLLHREMAKQAAHKAVELAAQEAAQAATRLAEIDAANALAFGPPPSLAPDAFEVETSSQSSSYRSSKASSKSNQSNMSVLEPNPADSRYLAAAPPPPPVVSVHRKKLTTMTMLKKMRMIVGVTAG